MIVVYYVLTLCSYITSYKHLVHQFPRSQETPNFINRLRLRCFKLDHAKEQVFLMQKFVNTNPFSWILYFVPSMLPNGLLLLRITLFKSGKRKTRVGVSQLTVGNWFCLSRTFLSSSSKRLVSQKKSLAKDKVKQLEQNTNTEVC